MTSGPFDFPPELLEVIRQAAEATSRQLTPELVERLQRVTQTFERDLAPQARALAQRIALAARVHQQLPPDLIESIRALAVPISPPQHTIEVPAVPLVPASRAPIPVEVGVGSRLKGIDLGGWQIVDAENPLGNGGQGVVYRVRSPDSNKARARAIADITEAARRLRGDDPQDSAGRMAEALDDLRAAEHASSFGALKLFGIPEGRRVRRPLEGWRSKRRPSKPVKSLGCSGS